MDTPTETPHGLTSDAGTNAPGMGTATPVLHSTGALTATAAAHEPRPDDPAWGIGAAFGVWLASVGLLVGGGVLALIGYLAIRPASMSAEGLQ
ncbi:MAG TPA: hypothetical protein VD835_19035, partial [Pyrinomonadaceae bacterium]|nr:hypothetical protein [Pyrinomonadaceae bacterium]